jgi:hypothetical protein
MKPRASAPKSHHQLVGLLFLVAAFAVLAGLALALRPDGSLLGLRLTQLSDFAFDDYRAVGLALALLVGSTQLRAALASFRLDSRGPRLAVYAGLILAGYVAALAFILDGMVWLQPVLLGAAAMELMLVAARVPARTRVSKRSGSRRR